MPRYQTGDIVFLSLSGNTVSGEAVFIGHPRGDKSGRVLVLATAADAVFEVDAENCSPTGRGDPEGKEYRQHFLRNHPRGLEGNP
jgi:hypothetical protein